MSYLIKKMYILYLLAGLIFLVIGALEFYNEYSKEKEVIQEETEAKGMHFIPEFDGQELIISDSYMHGQPWSERFYIAEGRKWKLVKTITHEP